MDRDTKFCESFRAFLANEGIEPVRLPPRSPNMNAHLERFFGSLKSECLNRVIPLGENHLRALVREYIRHYHEERNHQGLDNELITPLKSNIDPKSNTKCRSRLGGMLNYYYRDAA